MKKLLATTAVALSVVAGGAFADPSINFDTPPEATNPVSQIDGSLNTNNNNYTSQSGNTNVNGDTYTGTHVTNQSSEMNGYVSNPNLITSGADTCFGSSSGGISAAGIGISGGKTVVDENCVMLKNAKLLSSLGLKDAAVSLLINSNPDIAKAISQAYPELVIKLHGVTQ